MDRVEEIRVWFLSDEREKAKAVLISSDDIRCLFSALDAAKAENERIKAALEYVRTVWDKWYPADIFTGVSGDEGPLTIVDVRAAITDALAGREPCTVALVKARDSARRARWAHAERKRVLLDLMRFCLGVENGVARQRHTIGRLVAVLQQSSDVLDETMDRYGCGRDVDMMKMASTAQAIDAALTQLGLTWADAIEEGANDES
jgi:hypothetical protein